MMKIFLGVLLAGAFALTGLPTAVAGDVGVILMHGKWGTPKSRSPVGKLKSKLEDAGFEVVAPDMPWHRERYLAKGYEESMAEIDKAVETLKDRGATKIVVGGQSMGANAAMGYGARRSGLAGILVISAGHIPGAPDYAAKFEFDIDMAKEMVAKGKGDETATFSDRNQGVDKDVKMTANAYLSWFDPDGPAVMRKNTAKLSAPLGWFVGEDDSMATRGKAFAYDNAPDHPKNAYAVLPGNHKNLPYKGAKPIIKWLKSL